MRKRPQEVVETNKFWRSGRDQPNVGEAEHEGQQDGYAKKQREEHECR